MKVANLFILENSVSLVKMQLLRCNAALEERVAECHVACERNNSYHRVLID